ncbi:hypothetical protein PUN28_014434 [Cardiocondyla obscurior]|uniref:Uncharacterized protein n=1 Tax=Cardiocondyla obscurior TaxID=286306 RepID=A0AAW2F5E4_9HYME
MRRSLPRPSRPLERAAISIRARVSPRMTRRDTAVDSITSADEFIRTTRRPGLAIVSYLNELSNVFSLNTACGENYYPACVRRAAFCCRLRRRCQQEDRSRHNSAFHDVI